MSNNHYACINTKLMGIRARTLKDEDYIDLIREPDVAGVLTRLKASPFYGSYLADLTVPKDAHRQTIEVCLKKPLLSEFEKLFHYVSPKDRGLLDALLSQWDIECIRFLIRGLAVGELPAEKKGKLVYSKRSRIDYHRLCGSTDWNSFKQALKGTDYYRVLEIFPTLDKNECYVIEKNLERFYYDRIYHSLKKMNQHANDKLIKVLKKDIDLLNLVWCYRGKFLYDLPVDTLRAYELKGGFLLDTKVFNKLTEAETPEAFAKIIFPFKEYVFLFDHTKTRDLYMERRRNRYMYYAFQNLFYDADSGFGKTIAFLRLLEYEIKDIISIIESKRYNMTEAETEAFLIRNFKHRQ